MKRILSIDGGGIRGIIPAMILAQIEASTGKPAGALFDLVAGTSTGGIIATAIAKGVPAQQLVDLYVQGGAEIFGNPRGTIGNLVGGPKYAAAPLEAKLAEILGETRLSDLAGPDLLAVSYCMTGSQVEAVDDDTITSTRFPLIFSSALAKASPAQDFALKDVARATSAAPTYLPPAAIRSVAGETFICADGGVYQNNPALLAYARSLRLWPGGKDRIVLSLGTGSLEDPIDGKAAAGWGELQWISAGSSPPLISMMMDGSADMTAEVLDALVDHLRLDISLATPLAGGVKVAEAFDDASPGNIAAIQALAGVLLTRRAGDLEALLKRLDA